MFQNDYKLFTIKNYTLFCSPSKIIPNILQEIGRLREITFRSVGEGTNNSIDISKLVRPRKAFKFISDDNNVNLLLKNAGSDLNKFDKIISDIDIINFGIPISTKKTPYFKCKNTGIQC